MLHPFRTPLRLTMGRTASLHVQQGCEVFCRHGKLQLSIAPIAFADNCFEQVMWLGTGQSWRAPAGTWVQLMAATDTAGVEIQDPAEQPMQKSRPWLGTRRLWKSSMAALSARLLSGFARLRRERRAV